MGVFRHILWHIFCHLIVYSERAVSDGMMHLISEEENLSNDYVILYSRKLPFKFRHCPFTSSFPVLSSQDVISILKLLMGLCLNPQYIFMYGSITNSITQYMIFLFIQQVYFFLDQYSYSMSNRGSARKLKYEVFPYIRGFES